MLTKIDDLLRIQVIHDLLLCKFIVKKKQVWIYPETSVTKCKQENDLSDTKCRRNHFICPFRSFSAALNP